MKKKYPITVYHLGVAHEQIKRQIRAKQFGNFNPIYCTYRGKQYLVKSKEGDLSDPFRRDETYLKSLYIEL